MQNANEHVHGGLTGGSRRKTRKGFFVLSGVSGLACALIIAGSDKAFSNEACMRIVYSGPKTENAELAKNEAFQFKIPASRRNAIAANLQKCLDGAYAEKRAARAAGRAPYGYKQWYTKKSDGYDYCATYDPIVQGEGILVHCDHVKALPDGLFPGS